MRVSWAELKARFADRNACRSPTLLVEVSMVSNAIFKEKALSTTDSSESKRALCRPSKTTERSHEGMRCGLGGRKVTVYLVTPSYSTPRREEKEGLAVIHMMFGTTVRIVRSCSWTGSVNDRANGTGLNKEPKRITIAFCFFASFKCATIVFKRGEWK